MNIGGLLGGAFTGMDKAAGVQGKQINNQIGQLDLQQAMQKQQAQALASQLMQKMAQGQQNAGPATPGMQPVPGGNAPGGAPPQGGMTPSAPQGGGGFSPDNLMTALSQSNAPDAVKTQAFQQLMTSMNPYEKLTQNLDMQRQKLEQQSDLMNMKMKMMDQWQQSKNSTTQRGQDMNASNQAANRTSREDVAGEQIAGRQGVAGEQIASREKIAANKPAADAQTSAVEKQLSNQRALLQSMLSNGISPGKPEYQAEKKKYDSLQDQLTQAKTKTTMAAAPSKPQPTQADLDYLKAHPENQAQFDAHFGTGQ